MVGNARKYQKAFKAFRAGRRKHGKKKRVRKGRVVRGRTSKYIERWEKLDAVWEELSVEMIKEIEDAVFEFAVLINRGQRQLVPVRSGKLRDSTIFYPDPSDHKNVTYIIESGGDPETAQYARLVEFVYGERGARYFSHPINVQQRAYKSKMTRLINKAIKSAQK